MRLVWWVWVPLVACGDPTISDPCPGQKTCPGGSCCDYTYLCGDQCFMTPCGATQVTCINVNLTDGCYGGHWQGTLTGTGAPGSNVTFDISNHTITASAPMAGAGTIDCDTGIGSWTTSGSTAYTFHGTWRHTDDQGDRISGATWNATGASSNGTWDALRIE